MMRLMRLRALPLVIALVVALTSLTMAVARGQGRPVGETVLCLGLGTVSVLVDAQGRPVGPVHLCPDATPALFVADGLPPAPLVAPIGAARIVARIAATQPLSRAAPRPRARGPPSFI